MKQLFTGTLGLLLAFATPAQDHPADPQATTETVNLYRNLKKLAGQGILFGHQDDLAYGVGWKYVEGKSDIKEVTGDYPAVYGWDLGGLEVNSPNNLDGIPFKKMRQYIREGYERGGVITISWHARSPLGKEKGAWDTTHGTVASILPGGDSHILYKEWLDKIAGFLLSLKGSKGELIPVLFRPYHELTGNWFWWCRNTCTDFEFQTLWRFTYYYLQQEKKVHNLLYVYNTSGDFKTKAEFLQRYPGDEMVDVLSFDAYQYEDPQKNDWFEKNTYQLLKQVTELGKEKNKLTAFSETGYEAIPYANWWTQTLLNAIGDNPISYVLVWRNHGYAAWNKKMHYYAPYKGQTSEADFIKFYQLDRTLFEKEVAAKKLYSDL
ncbi:glycosyl hydrolase [Paraflavitalea sp. CAU 1676]|uniref:glycoside hydrolase family 26 protein n=1 Tax=Paraflavitalea sp. CAU 1676 TaxID=3032598 RepID=UPI0023DA643C|nr:glycosyl hydrolase [Paraflavitalea sp. CAU 1676]MDF2188837.1 glycosyl hydrolase [Paraflavitalea sp. CAU 1676]